MKQRAIARSSAAMGMLLTLYPLSASPALPLLTQADQINRLTLAQARAGYPVDIRGVVTYADVQLGHIFLQDRTAGTFVYFQPTGREPPLLAGQTIEVTGTTTPGDFSPCIKDGRYIITGTARLPIPKRLPFDQLLTGRWACYWTELEGIVLPVRVQPGSIQLNLRSDGGNFLVILRESPEYGRLSAGSNTQPSI